MHKWIIDKHLSDRRAYFSLSFSSSMNDEKRFVADFKPWSEELLYICIEKTESQGTILNLFISPQYQRR